ncbi:MAG: D-alanyl-D-alanine carboxypeptidase [Rubellimicrobium sp.]|nr:D-alanyl-D-alanine carboxypeptidase [Rubellimicrobium sp.]
MTRPLALLALLVALLPLPGAAQDFVTRATAAWVHDMTTDTLLLSHNADTALPPASMSKLMTLYMAFEAIAQGRLSVDDELTVSQHAMDYGGSSMFLRAGERVRVEDLLRGIIVLSGNDASTVIAEALSPDGTEAGFARMMTERARALGMTGSTFANANGWPDPGQRMTMHDLGILAEHIIRDFPTFYPLFSEREFLFDGRVPANSQNRNPILALGLGADGLKTGHTSEAGYGLVGSARQGDRRVVFVITGLESAAAREEEAARILNWAFRQFALRDLGRAGDRLAEAGVWMGAQPSVGLVLPADLSILVPVVPGGGGGAAEVVFAGPLPAPVTAGAEVARLRITREGLPQIDLPLVAETDVPPAGFVERTRVAVRVLLAMIGLGDGSAPGGPAQGDPAQGDPLPAGT